MTEPTIRAKVWVRVHHFAFNMSDGFTDYAPGETFAWRSVMPGREHLPLIERAPIDHLPNRCSGGHGPMTRLYLNRRYHCYQKRSKQ